MKKISLNIFIGYLVLIIIAVSTSILGIYIARKVQRECELQIKTLAHNMVKKIVIIPAVNSDKEK